MMNESCNTRKEINTAKASRHECLDCENYKRKIKESEQTLSSRDVLIQMLQREIQKIEDRYRKSIDEYEKLRFSHCSTVQELGNLKEIYRKLEEECERCYGKKSSVTKSVGSEVEIYQQKQLCIYHALQKYIRIIIYNLLLDSEKYISFDASIQSQCCLKSSYNNLFKDVAQVGNIIENQNEALKQLLIKFLEEVKQTKCGNFKDDESPEVVSYRGTRADKHNEYIRIVEDMNTQIRDLNSLVTKLRNEFITITEDMHQQIEKSNDYVERLKAENGTIRDQLEEKKSVLSSCLCVLEQNHYNINNLSTNVESIIQEKEVLLEETNKLKETIKETEAHCREKDEDILALKSKLDSVSEEHQIGRQKLNDELGKCRECILQLQQELEEKQKALKVEKCTLCEQLEQSQENNKALSDTVLIVTDENKNNLRKIANLNVELKEVNEELECSQSTLKRYIAELENEIDRYKSTLVAVERAECGTTSGTNKGLEETKELEEKIKYLESQLKEVSLENSEYEEENRYYCQKIDSLRRDLRFLQEENFKIEEDNRDCCEKMTNLRKEYEGINNHKESEIKQLNEEINRLKQENSDKKCEKETTNLGELDRLNAENKHLFNQIQELQQYCYDYNSKNGEMERKNALLMEEINRACEEKRKTDYEFKHIYNKMIEFEQQCAACCCKNEEMKKEINVLSEELKISQMENEKTNKENNNKISEITQQLKNAQEEKDTVEKENEDLRNEMKYLKENCNGHRNACEEIKAKMEKLQLALTTITEEKNALTSENENIRHQVENLQKQLSDNENEYDKIERDIKENEREIAKLECENSNLKNEISKFQEQLSDYENIKQDVNSINNELKIVQQEKANAENENINLKKQMEDLNRHFSTYDSENEEIKNKLDMMNQQLKLVRDEKLEIENEYRNLKIQMEKLHHNCSVCRKENNEIQEELAGLHEDLKRVLEEKAMIEKENDVLKNKLAKAKLCSDCIKNNNEERKEVHASTRSLNNVQEENTSNFKSCIHHDSGNQDVFGQSAAMTDELKVALQEKEIVENENINLKIQLQALQKHILVCDSKNEEMKNTICLTVEELQIAQQKKEAIEIDNENLRLHMKQLKQELVDQNNKSGKIKENITKITEELRITQEEKLQTDMENANLKTHIVKIQQEYSSVSASNEQTKKKIDTMNEELKRVYDEKSKADNENKALKDKINNLQKDFTDTHQKTDNEILLLQNKITELENSQRGKTEQISNCCTETSNIKKMLSDQQLATDNYLCQIRELEDKKISLENEKQQTVEIIKSLQEKVERYEKTAEQLKDAKSLIEELRKEIEAKEIEVCQRGCMLTHLEECFDKSNKTLEICDQEMKGMHRQVEDLKTENYELKKQLQKYVYDFEVSKAEVDTLHEKLNSLRRHSKQVELKNEKLCNNLQQNVSTEKDLTDLRQKYNDLLEAGKEKDKEFVKLQDQYQLLKESSEANRIEYERIKKEYRNLKDSLAHQISSYKAGIDLIHEEPCCKSDIKSSEDQRMEELELKIIEKETTIQIIQHKNSDLNFKISQLKENVHKLVSDNKQLKNALNNLLNTLIDKLKNSDSCEDISKYCSSLITNGVLDSISDIVKPIVHSGNASTKNTCNCMSVIRSTYKIDQFLTSPPDCDPSHCGKKMTDVMKYENKKFGSSSEVLNIPSSSGTADQNEPQKISKNDCCENTNDVKRDEGGPADIKSKSTTSEPETFIIEPDNLSNTSHL